MLLAIKVRTDHYFLKIAYYNDTNNFKTNQNKAGKSKY